MLGPVFLCVVLSAVQGSQQDLAPLTSSRVPPSVDGASYIFVGGERRDWRGPTTDVVSPIYVTAEKAEKAVIGRLSVMDSEAALETLGEALKAWDGGQGIWPQKSMAQRARAIEAYLDALTEKRSEIVEMLMWEIAKTAADAAKEFDRTIGFAKQVIASVANLDRFGGDAWHSFSSLQARVERGPVGVTLMLAPFNYPLNEMYAMMIPALLTGNVVLLKLPAIGALTHVLTVDALEKTLPKGVVNFVTGSGRKVLPGVMATGKVDAIGFIGGSKGADALVKAHPHPHRLRVFSQLEGKNMAIVLPDADLEKATSEILVGALSYNGQRCTALKLILVHASIADDFLKKLVPKVEALKAGLPWSEDQPTITPLPEPKKPAYLAELVDDALAKGASIRNPRGADLRGALFTPAVVAFVDDSMRLFHEEQFGPVVPVGKFDDLRAVVDAAKKSWSGQQVSIFTQHDSKSAATLIDALSTIVGRANLNLQCQRGPDSLPFSGRRSSAMGTMSVYDAIRAFSVEVVIATHPDDADLVTEIEANSNLLAPDYAAD